MPAFELHINARYIWVSLLLKNVYELFPCCSIYQQLVAFAT